MILHVSKSKNSATYYVQKSFRREDGSHSSKIVEKLGSLDDLKARFGDEDPINAAKEYIKELTLAEKEEREKILVEYDPSKLLKKNEQHSYNGGYLFLQKIYHDLGLHKICKEITKKYKIKYNLNEILSTLLYTRVLYPGSKHSSLKSAKKFLTQPKHTQNQVYRALNILSQESDYIQSAVYKNSLKLFERNTNVLYYDCTNYFFETEEECGLRQYGRSKENRPDPIVQMGLFMDMDGIPLAFCINPGSTNEQITLKPLEQKLNDNFGISKLVVCTDDGLSSYENSFRIMKSEFEAKPVYLQRDDRIRVHFLICFLALLLCKILEKKVNRGINHFSSKEIIEVLADMNFTSIDGEGYIPHYTRNKITNALHGSSGFRSDKQIITKKKMKEIISYTKNSRSSKKKEILKSSK